MRREEFVLARKRIAEQSIPEMIKLLSSDKLHIRFLAEMCLRDATTI